MSYAKLIEVWQNVRDAFGELSEAVSAMDGLVPVEEPQSDPGTDDGRSWEGVIGVQQEVLGTFPAGLYDMAVAISPPADLRGAKKDFRVLLFDVLNLGRGRDADRQVHVECGASVTKVYLGGHNHLGGEGWPGQLLGTFPVNEPQSLISYHGLSIPGEFALVLGETVTHDRGRVTSPAGTKYKITMRKVG